MAEVRIRKDVWKLDEWDPILLWYAKAVAAMRLRPINDPTSWRYQAAIHEYRRNRDPYASPTDTLPSAADQERFWQQCQHGSWFFLPWHRMYLSVFEQIVAATVSQLGGPADWALPYWNYSDASNPNVRRLPPAFRANKLPDGTVNALRVDARRPGANDGNVIANDNQVDIQTCLEEDIFTSEDIGGDPGFGGGRTEFSHGGDAIGDVESTPHGSMHVAVGGFGGWMSGFNTAGLDPIFWLHHCNIDRLWCVWRSRAPGNVDPTEPAWLTAIPFEFNLANGEVVSMTCSQVTDTTAPPLSYEYEDVSDPLGGAVESPVEVEERPSMRKRPIPEMVGATDRPLTLTGEAATTSVPVSQPTGPAASETEAVAAPRRIHLNIENITSAGQPGSYTVYVNLPPGAKPEDHPELYAGLLPMFGVEESTDASRPHPASGLTYRLDITDVVGVLESRNDWNPDEMRVTFVPEEPLSELEGVTVIAPAPVQVGRVSLYYS